MHRLPAIGGLLALSLLTARAAHADDPTLAVDATTGFSVGVPSLRPWAGLGVQGHVPVQQDAIFHVGGRIQFTTGFVTSFVSVSPLVAIKSEILPDFSLFADLSGDAAVDLANPGLVPHGRIAIGGFYRSQGFYPYGELFGARQWRGNDSIIGVGYGTDFL